MKVQVADVGRLAFPVDSDQILANPCHPNEKLSAARLMHTFGDEILARYNLPGADGGDYDDDRVDSDDNEQSDEYGNDEDDSFDEHMEVDEATEADRQAFIRMASRRR